MSQRIIRLRQARADIVETAVYLDERSPDAALRFMEAVEETLAAIAEMPRIGAECTFRHPGLAGMRMLPVRGFDHQMIFYRLTGDVIELIRVYHAARDIDELIRTRLEQVEQGALLIPHEEAVRHIEELKRREKPDNPEPA
jgi:toxin ParE1/3/4